MGGPCGLVKGAPHPSTLRGASSRCCKVLEYFLAVPKVLVVEPGVFVIKMPSPFDEIFHFFSFGFRCSVVNFFFSLFPLFHCVYWFLWGFLDFSGSLHIISFLGVLGTLGFVSLIWGVDFFGGLGFLGFIAYS